MLLPHPPESIFNFSFGSCASYTTFLATGTGDEPPAGTKTKDRTLCEEERRRALTNEKAQGFVSSKVDLCFAETNPHTGLYCFFFLLIFEPNSAFSSSFRQRDQAFEASFEAVPGAHVERVAESSIVRVGFDAREY